MIKTNRGFSESLEDYLEAIYVLGGQNVRSVDLANRLGVSRASVNKAVNSLIEKQLVEKERYGGIYLTAFGRATSQGVEKKHQILKHFLTDVLGVPEATANLEACGIEHIISADTAKRIEKLIEAKKKNDPR